MYSVVLMMSLSGGADAVEFGKHRGGCHGGSGCDGGAPVVVVGCTGGAPAPAPAPAGCTGGEVVVGCTGGAGCNGGGCHGGGGLFGRLFHRHKNGCHGGSGCDGGAPAPAPCCSAPAPAPAPVGCTGCTGGNGCNGGHGGLFKGLFHRHRNGGCTGAAPAPACDSCAPAAPAGCVGGSASVAPTAVPTVAVASRGVIVVPASARVNTTPASIALQQPMLVARR